MADVRKRVLEEADYRVIAASNLKEVAKGCIENTPDLVLIGYSVPKPEQLRVSQEVRKYSKAPILQLFRDQPPATDEYRPFYTHHSNTPEDFLEAVNEILSTKAEPG